VHYLTQAARTQKTTAANNATAASSFQLAASNGLGSPQVKYSDHKVGFGLLVLGLIFLFLMPMYAVAQLPRSFHSTPASFLASLIVLVIFLLATLLFSAIGVYSLFADTYACSDGFIKIRGKQSKHVLQAMRWDHIQEVMLGWGQGRSFPYIRDTTGTRYIVREEIWLRAGSELARCEFASRSSALLATFHAGQPVALAQLSVSHKGIAVPRGKTTLRECFRYRTIEEVYSRQAKKRVIATASRTGVPVDSGGIQ